MAESEETPERCMVDTNVLVYATVDAAPKCEEARQWMARLQQKGAQLLATPQIYREYLVVLTRGPVVNQAFALDEAMGALSELRGSLRTLLPTAETFEILLALVQRYEVKGKQVHDAHLAATMLTYDVRSLATYNQSDFERFEEVTLDELGRHRISVINYSPEELERKIQDARERAQSA